MVPAVAEEYPQLRLTCMTWRRELDLCSHNLEPSVCDIPRILSLFPNLRKLDLSGCSLTVRDESLENIHKLQKLQHLDLKGCSQVHFYHM
jgi:Leucine-rich repeat (LRR) protein